MAGLTATSGYFVLHQLSAFAPGFVAFPKSGSHAYFRERLFERADSLKAAGVLKHYGIGPTPRTI